MKDSDDDDEKLHRAAARENATAILQARERAETALSDAREALREAAERLRLALALGNLGDWSWNAITDVVTMGPTAARAFGVEPSTVVTRAALRELIHEEDRPGIVAGVQEAITHHTSYDLEYRFFRPSGELCWMAAQGRGSYGADGTLLGTIGVVQDITDRKRIEEALKDESRVLELINKTGAAIGSQLDLQALVQRVTDAATEVSGAKFGAFFYNVIDQAGESFNLSALSGAPPAAFGKFGLPRNTPLFDPTFRGERVVRSNDITRDPRYGTMAPHHGMPQGHLPVCSYLAVPVISRSGQTLGGLFFGHPQPGVFTERAERIIVGVAAQAAVAIDNARLYETAQQAVERERAARSQVERMSEIKDQFLATLSHELRTPLSAILGWTQVVRKRALSGDDLNNAMEIIERNARAQAKLIEDLLDMNRITSGKLRLDIQLLEPERFIDAAIETVRPAAAARGLQLEKFIDPAAGPLSADPGRLQQVMWNLLSNAIKFTPKEGKVTVRLKRVDSQVELSVSDSGMGIKPEFLAHLFERFRQADASTTRQHGGLGLGLSIVKQLVELHGGSVTAHSEGENRGTTITVLLPLAEGPSLPQAMNVSADYRVADLTGLRVLVVDDERDACELIERVLSDCGAEVRMAQTGEEALAHVQKRWPHVLLSDVAMPGMDGYELLTRVHALDETSHLPAIALTAFARAEDRARTSSAGFLVHLSKPLEPLELVATVASVTGRPLK